MICIQWPHRGMICMIEWRFAIVGEDWRWKKLQMQFVWARDDREKWRRKWCEWSEDWNYWLVITDTRLNFVRFKAPDIIIEINIDMDNRSYCLIYGTFRGQRKIRNEWKRWLLRDQSCHSPSLPPFPPILMLHLLSKRKGSNLAEMGTLRISSPGHHYYTYIALYHFSWYKLYPNFLCSSSHKSLQP